MSAFGPKRTLGGALHMSAFGRKADIAITLSASVARADPADEHREPALGRTAHSW
jgi:hypothetical protein